MKYTLTDLRQAATGAFIFLIVFFVLKSGEPFAFNPMTGFIMLSIILYIYYEGFNGNGKAKHFFIDAAVTFAMAGVLAILFDMITFEQIKSFEVFGSIISIGTIVGLPGALLFDKFNFTNPMRRMFIRGRR